jgi:hypothetical protein
MSPREGEHEVIGFLGQIRMRYPPRRRIHPVQG